jgi:hypothetical protein
VSLCAFDHLVVTAPTLDEGAAWLEARLGLPLAPGGRHPAMGTHNRLLSLGPDAYLEVIAIDPDAPGPSHPRWFDIDNYGGQIRLANWVIRCDNVNDALGLAPARSGVPRPFARGDLRWQMAVPDTGRLPFDSTFPALIAWEGGAHPAPRLPDHGVRLGALTLRHPRAEALRAALAPLIADPRLTLEPGAPGLSARLDTPAGPVTL